MSRPARGAWVEIELPDEVIDAMLKSRPARGAWVEIRPSATALWKMGRAPQGARGLKLAGIAKGTTEQGRAPQGARGLKSEWRNSDPRRRQSRPARGAWVEISPQSHRQSHFAVAPRKGRVG